MGSRVFLRKQTRYVIATSVFMIGVVTSVLMPMYASADALTVRSIALSTSGTAATDVSYDVKFTPVKAAGAFVVDFCSNSPVIGAACTDPTSDGFDVTGAASTTANFTDVTGSGHQVLVAGSMTAATPVDVAVTGITNPSTAGPLYARIVTYDTKTDAQSYSSTNDATADTGYKDSGGVALSITNDVKVSGQVLESMTFCVSGAATGDTNPIGASCTGTLTAPTLKLGETNGSVTALSSGAVSSGDIFTQLSTNASGGAVVSLKSSAAGCGGLLRAGAPGACDIKPVVDTGGITAGQALFGIKTATATGTDGNATGTLQPATTGTGVYNNTKYALGYVMGDATGVTSPYGDPFLDSAGAPVNNQNMKLTFGASISNNTPAGTYSTNLSLIATGKF